MKRSPIILTPDYFGDFSVDVPLDQLFYKGEKIEADVLLNGSGMVLCYQPKGDVAGLPDFIEPHEISFNKFPPAPKASGKRIPLDKDGAVI